MKAAVADCARQLGTNRKAVGAIGISYQMHGLVTLDNDLIVLRPSIIWCDSRAVNIGEKAYKELGEDYCLSHLLNSPGNFTASKLKWVRDNEPGIFSKIFRIMLPGDYISMRLTGEITTTFTGLSEGIFWDFKENRISEKLMNYYGFDTAILPHVQPSFSIHGHLKPDVAADLGLTAGIPVSYKAGDQPNNALSLNVLAPGDVAATAGTSGVIYGVTDKKKYDPLSRVNTFLHVNNSEESPKLGILLCINGTGILNSWIRRLSAAGLSYDQMNEAASGIPVGSEGLKVIPFGNGAERMLGNINTGAHLMGINFNIHTPAHIFRAAQEGIAFSFRYGLDIMKETGVIPQVIRAGHANMFLSNVFRTTISTITGISVLLYNTDGSAGAARGAGIGCGHFRDESEAFNGLTIVGQTDPDMKIAGSIGEAYLNWKHDLGKLPGLK